MVNKLFQLPLFENPSLSEISLPFPSGWTKVIGDCISDFRAGVETTWFGKFSLYFPREKRTGFGAQGRGVGEKAMLFFFFFFYKSPLLIDS